MRNENELMNYAMKQESVCRKNDSISDALFEEYGVNRGLRDMNGKGVLTGLTTISKIVSFEDVNGVKTPCDGQLWYRGYNVQNLVRQMGENGFGFEKTASSKDSLRWRAPAPACVCTYCHHFHSGCTHGIHIPQAWGKY